MCPSLLSFPRLTLFLQHTFDFPRISNAKAKHQHFLSFELGRIELSPIPTDRFSSSSRRSIEARLAFHPISSVLPSSRFPSLLFLPRSVDFDNSSQLSLLFSLWPRFRETKNHPRICYVHFNQRITAARRSNLRGVNRNVRPSRWPSRRNRSVYGSRLNGGGLAPSGARAEQRDTRCRGCSRFQVDWLGSLAAARCLRYSP